MGILTANLVKAVWITVWVAAGPDIGTVERNKPFPGTMKQCEEVLEMIVEKPGRKGHCKYGFTKEVKATDINKG